MYAESPLVAPNWVDRILAVLCVALFWVIPFSPLVAIAAVKKTGRSGGWPRKVARTGAVLCIAYTTAAAGLIAWLGCLLYFGK